MKVAELKVAVFAVTDLLNPVGPLTANYVMFQPGSTTKVHRGLRTVIDRHTDGQPTDTDTVLISLHQHFPLVT